MFSKNEESNGLERFTTGLLVVACAILAWHAIFLAANKAYALDEFLYAHRAWQFLRSADSVLSVGRPFLTDIVYSPFVLIGGDNPASMIYLRYATLIWLALTIVVLAALSARFDRKAAKWAVLSTIFIALTTPKFVWYETEIRPDGIAILFVLASVLVLSAKRLGDRTAAALAALLLLAGCLTSLKAIFYGSVFSLAFGLDLVHWYRSRPQILRSAGIFAFTFLVGFGLLVALVVMHGDVSKFWAGFYERPANHEQFYPGFSPTVFFNPFYRESWLLCWLAACGGLLTAIEAFRSWNQSRVFGRDLLMIMLFVSSWASFAVQKAPYAYSLLPGMALSIFFAARAVVAIGKQLKKLTENHALVCGGLVGTIVVAAAWAAHIGLQPIHGNHRQIELQAMIGELVAPEEPVYDMSATYVFRPRAHRFAFLDLARKRQFGEVLMKEVPQAIVKEQAVLFVYERRFHEWRHTPLAMWILQHFQKYNNDLYVWGMKYSCDDRAQPATFHAIKSGRYFVQPPGVLSGGSLWIGNRVITEPIFELEKGFHQVTHDLSNSSRLEAFYIMWLPASGERFNPEGEFPSFELGRHLLP